MFEKFAAFFILNFYRILKYSKKKIPLLVGYERELWKNIENSLVKQVASLSETILNFINPRNIESQLKCINIPSLLFIVVFAKRNAITFIKPENLDERNSDEEDIKGILGIFFLSHDVKKWNSIT